MNRLLSFALAVAVVMGTMPVAAGGAQLPATADKGPLMQAALREAMVTAGVLAACPQSASTSALKEAARKIPLGKKVKVRLLSGETHYGKLRAVGDDGVTIDTREKGKRDSYGEWQQGAKITMDVPYAMMQTIKRDTLHWGAKVGMIAGAAVVTGVVIGNAIACAGC